MREYIKQQELGIQILAEGSINVAQDFMAHFKLMADSIVLVLNKGISVGYFAIAFVFQKITEGYLSGVFAVISKSLVQEFVLQHVESSK